MEGLILILFFIMGTIMGSFFYVVALRLSKEESIVTPASHCHECGHKLNWYEMIPIISFVIQLGKCRKCNSKLSIYYLIMELVTGIMFAVCYHVFGLSIDLIIALIFISALIIIIISDIEFMIIIDEVLIVATLLIIMTYFFTIGITKTAMHIYAGVGAFATMYLLKKIGDFLFKKESLGGGDIKLMFLFGLVLGYPMAICSIFLAAFIAFPIALFILINKKDNLIPFGPFLSIAAIIIFISKVNFNDIIQFLLNTFKL